MIDNLFSLIVKSDRFDNNVIYFGADMAINKFTRYLKILGLDPTRLFSR